MAVTTLKIPSKLKIGAHEYQIIQGKAPKGADLDRSGAHDPQEKLIFVDNSLPETHMLATLIHEIIHALNNELSETDTEYLAQGLTQVLHDNKLLK